MPTNIVIVGVLIAVALVLVLPRVAASRGWRATMTPLASIIGSGFLVLGPILDDTYVVLAPAAMLVLCGGAYAFGGAIRINIAARAVACWGLVVLGLAIVGRAVET